MITNKKIIKSIYLRSLEVYPKPWYSNRKMGTIIREMRTFSVILRLDNGTMQLYAKTKIT